MRPSGDFETFRTVTHQAGSGGRFSILTTSRNVVRFRTSMSGRRWSTDLPVAGGLGCGNETLGAVNSQNMSLVLATVFK
jgi:hypothetical protein